MIDQRTGCLEGGLLIAADQSQPFALPPAAAASGSSQARTAQAMAAALAALRVLPEPLWLAISLDPGGLSAASFLEAVSTALSDDLPALQRQVGARLVVVAPISVHHPGEAADLLSSLSEWHTIASVWDHVPTGVLGAPPSRFCQRVFVGPSLVTGIHNDPTLQRQWAFLSHGLSALAIPLVATGVESEPELAWLRLHGCEAVADHHRICSLRSLSEHPLQSQPVTSNLLHNCQE